MCVKHTSELELFRPVTRPSKGENQLQEKLAVIIKQNATTHKRLVAIVNGTTLTKTGTCMRNLPQKMSYLREFNRRLDKNQTLMFGVPSF